MKSEEFNKILEENEIVIVDFYADWCQPCKLLTPSLDNACKKSAEEVKLLKIDVDEEKNVALATSFNVRSIPFVVRYENGKVTNTMVGFMGEKYVEDFVAGKNQKDDKQ